MREWRVIYDALPATERGVLWRLMLARLQPRRRSARVLRFGFVHFCLLMLSIGLLPEPTFEQALALFAGTFAVTLCGQVMI